MQGITESMAGRAAILPLDKSEGTINMQDSRIVCLTPHGELARCDCIIHLQFLKDKTPSP